jgi:hypothetical protein
MHADQFACPWVGKKLFDYYSVRSHGVGPKSMNFYGDGKFKTLIEVRIGNCRSHGSDNEDYSQSKLL